MNGFRLTNYINDLNQQIYASVEQIKHRSSKADINKNTSHDFLDSQYRVSEAPYNLLSGDVNWSLQNISYDTEKNSDYIVSNYKYASNVIKEPRIIIDLMFKNNREFDFKV